MLLVYFSLEPLDSIVSKLDQEAASVALKESPLDLPKENYPTSTGSFESTG